MSTNNSDIAERIAAARHEAESLKEKIKQKKDALADTTRKFFLFIRLFMIFFHATFGYLCGCWEHSQS